MIYDKKIETASRKEIEKIQLERLKKIVKKVYKSTPFYKKKFDEINLKVSDIKTLDDIRKIPFTTKEDLRQNYPYGLMAVKMDDIIRIHASSGTSGKPTVVFYTKNDMENWTECVARIIAAAGGEKTDIVQICFGYGLFTGALGLHQGWERIGASVIPASAGNTARQIMLMKDLKTTAIVSTPSYGLYIADKMKELGYKKEDFNLRIGLFGSEASSAAMQKELEKRLHLKPTDNYGLSEVMGPGVSGECLEKAGMHINEDHFLCEIVDPKTLEPVKAGESGELVITTLTKEGLPLLRYRTKDITSITYEKCKCGRTSARMARIQGRSDDMLKIRGVNIFPSQIEEVLLSIPEVGSSYQIVLTTKNHLDQININVELSTEQTHLLVEFSKLQNLVDTIKKKLKTVLQIEAGVRLVEPMSLQKGAGKAVRVIDKREKI